MLLEDGHREVMLNLYLVMFSITPNLTSRYDLLAIRRRGGGHDAEFPDIPGLEPPGLITVT